MDVLAQNQKFFPPVKCCAGVNASLNASANASIKAGNIPSVNASVQGGWNGGKPPFWAHGMNDMAKKKKPAETLLAALGLKSGNR